jgi:hypothetical protein
MLEKLNQWEGIQHRTSQKTCQLQFYINELSGEKPG